MKILWISWKDIKNPKAGGAEMIANKLLSNLVKNRHAVKLVSCSFKGAQEIEKINGYEVIRKGNRFTVYWETYKYYKKYLFDWPDLIIEEINTIPFFSTFYKNKKSRLFLFFHQLCRKIWFYEIFFPLSAIGYLLEPIYLWLLSANKVITISKSTQDDLLKYGFKANRISIISEGIEIEPLKDLESLQKYKKTTLLSMGTVRAMKRTDHIVKAFEIVKRKIPDLQLIIAGDADVKYGKKVLELIKKSKYSTSIQCLGRISKEKKVELMQKSHLIAVTSVKEGWGLIVTEANSQGTPAVVYGVDGLRDSVKNNKTGIICQQNNPENLAKNIIELLNNPKGYQNLRINAWQWSKEINFHKSYQDFKTILEIN